jgi:Domain of unknown function (DUF4389)
MSDYPVTYKQQPPEKRNRLSLLFRWFLAIPHYIWSFFYAIAAFFAVIIAWVAIVVTGRWPRGLYDFMAGFLRYSGRLSAYLSLIVDTYPPFDNGEHPEYPVQIIVAPPKEQYSRVKALFRFILAIPISIVQYVLSIWLFVLSIGIWLVGVFAGRTSADLTEATRMPMTYYVRSSAYFLLVTEDWPPFDPGPA